MCELSPIVLLTFTVFTSPHIWVSPGMFIFLAVRIWWRCSICTWWYLNSIKIYFNSLSRESPCVFNVALQILDMSNFHVLIRSGIATRDSDLRWNGPRLGIQYLLPSYLTCHQHSGHACPLYQAFRVAIATKISYKPDLEGLFWCIWGEGMALVEVPVTIKCCGLEGCFSFTARS